MSSGATAMRTMLFKEMCPIMFLAKSSSEMFVPANNTINFSFRMERHMSMLTFNQFKIFHSIIRRIAVNVMNQFVWFENSANIFFHYQYMLKNITIFSCSMMFWVEDHPISLLRFNIRSSFPTYMSRGK